MIGDVFFVLFFFVPHQAEVSVPLSLIRSVFFFHLSEHVSEEVQQDVLKRVNTRLGRLITNQKLINPEEEYGIKERLKHETPPFFYAQTRKLP